ELPPLEKVPTVVSTSAQLDAARQQLDRAKNLSARTLISQSDLELAQTRFDTAKAAYDAALASARQLRADIDATSSSLRLAPRDHDPCRRRAEPLRHQPRLRDQGWPAHRPRSGPRRPARRSRRSEPRARRRDVDRRVRRGAACRRHEGHVQVVLKVLKVLRVP